jgi:indolepyruvate ferredoxin oxidoreductase
VKADPRFLKSTGTEVFSGNELLVKGCLETEGGTHLWTGYPGSPVSAFFDVAQGLQELLKARGIRATIANNEALGAAMVNGSQMHGLRAIALNKSVGVHVAADALALGNLVGAHPEGGAVIVLGDDPWSDSTQVAADSRFLCKHLMMPVIEPADLQELKDWVDLAFKLSRESELYIGYLVTTNQADGGGTVATRENHFPQTSTLHKTELDTSALDLDRNVLLPPRTWRKEQAIHERFERLWASARHHGLNRLFRPAQPAAKLGFVTSAQAYCYLRHALAELGLDGLFPILKLGLTYPLDPEVITEFASGLEDLFVIEERRGFLEEQIIDLLSRARQHADHETTPLAQRVWGKRFPHDLRGIPDTRGLNPSKLIDRLGRLFLALPELKGRMDTGRVRSELALLEEVKEFTLPLPERTPTFCPGCPHRDSSSVLKEIQKEFGDAAYMRRAHGTEPVDLVFHGDTGCYTMLMYEPNKNLMHNYSGMGLGGGTGAGIDPFIRNKQVVFMGDSTFFHSGQIAISNSLKQGQDITYILLDNKTTAMTGHQTTPGLEENLLGEETFAQNIERIVAAMSEGAGATVVRVNPAERETYRSLLEKAILQDGVKVVVADKECGITFHRREAREERRVQRDLGFLPSKRFINIAEEVCEGCLECTRSTGCPGLTLQETSYGPKVQIDKSWCVSDGACTRFMVAPAPGVPRVKACPSFEEVVLTRTQRPLPPIDRLDFSQLPVPRTARTNTLWNAYLAGVGGMGIGTATAILVLAGHREGYRVQFCDKKGLAIRNGGVYSMLTYTGKEAPYTSNVIPYGKAHLILGVDLLEAARALDPSANQRVGSRTRTAAVLNTHKTPTIATLLGQEDFAIAELERAIHTHTRAENYFAHNVSLLSEQLFGTQLYLNVMMLGIAFQRGLMPLQLASLEWAIQTSLGGAAAENLKAFHAGRLLAHDATALERALNPAKEPATYPDILADKVDILTRTRRNGAALAARYRHLVERASEHLQVTGQTLADFALRVYDLVQFDGIEYARGYVEAVRSIHAIDLASKGYAATRAVIWNLHKVMAIKDEVFVAHQLTSEEKYRRDRARFGVDPSRGDALEYRHLNRPEFALFGRRFAWDMTTRDWMLKAMSQMRWLRRALPQWHAKEKDFRDWYAGLLEQYHAYAADARRYDLFLKILQLPEKVSGYREIRYPKMAAAQAQAEEWLRQLKTPDPVAPPLVPV